MRKLLLLIVVCCSVCSYGQAPFVFKEIDLNPGPAGSFPMSFFKFGNQFLFTAIDSIHGRELWISDGSFAGTGFVKDMNPGTVNSSMGSPVQLNNRVFFVATDTAHGYELWVTDGTPNGTHIFKEFIPGKKPSMTTSANALIVLGNQILFVVRDTGGSTGGGNLWVSDGTLQGTQLVKDVYGAGNFTIANGKVFFSAQDSALAYGAELWVTDGTTQGTYMVKDINPGVADSNPMRLATFNGKLYFLADNGIDGQELWVTDGTSNGTVLLKDINQGTGSSNAIRFTEYNGKLYFSANDSSHGAELWVTDGTSNGTQMIKDIYPGNTNANPGGFIAHNSMLYFSAREDVYGAELWKTDGTVNGTQKVIDLNAGTPIRHVGRFIVCNKTLFFTHHVAGDDSAQLFITDGTATGTKMIQPTGPDIRPVNFNLLLNLFVFDSTLYLSADYSSKGSELWSIKDTSTPPTVLNDIDNSPGITIHPNPVRGILTVTGIEQGEELRITNITGVVVTPVKRSNGDKIEINTEGLPAGVYILRAGEETVRFVKAE